MSFFVVFFLCFLSNGPVLAVESVGYFYISLFLRSAGPLLLLQTDQHLLLIIITMFTMQFEVTHSS